MKNESPVLIKDLLFVSEEFVAAKMLPKIPIPVEINGDGSINQEEGCECSNGYRYRINVDGKISKDDMGCGCCSESEELAPKEALKEIDEEIQSLIDVREAIKKFHKLEGVI